MTSRKNTTCITICLLWFSYNIVAQEPPKTGVIILKNGNKFAGTIVDKNEKVYNVIIPDVGEMEVEKKNVEKIEYADDKTVKKVNDSSGITYEESEERKKTNVEDLNKIIQAKKAEKKKKAKENKDDNTDSSKNPRNTRWTDRKKK